MSRSGLRAVEHEIEIAAPPAAVYRLIAEVENWPLIFPPTIHVERVAEGGHEERIRIWATANGEAKTWASRRVLDPVAGRVAFRQEVPAHPVAAMAGAWVVSEGSAAGSARVVLTHEYRAVDDDPGHLAWIDEAVDRNSVAELAALKANVERVVADEEDALTFSFEDTVRVAGSARDLWDFVNEADRWSERLPHVAEVRLTEDVPGLQELEMDTRARDGSTHTTRSYRVTCAPEWIAYKQTVLPALLSLHTGRWTFVPEDGGTVAATSRHTVTLNAANVGSVLGAGATVADAREYVRTALSTNSVATLRYAQRYAEERVGV
ncbi:aromatase/cyclase (plasmid) [Streptomyces sp. BI20]|uniref:aromatase/cyclase n=1 Tax=Streptomyces sp. BI20 TaxID=3403460 RepID=UPI003C7602C1